MRAFLQQQWFMVGIFFLMPLGALLGYLHIENWLPGVATFQRYSAQVTPLILFCMAVSLDSGRMWRAIRAPGPVLWACLVNLGLLPLLTWPTLQWQLHPDLQVGLMAAVSVPCTMAAASVWTRKAAGNDAVSLLVTVTTNGLCFLITPMWLAWGIGQSAAIDTLDLMQKLVWTALVPILAGQLTRLIPPIRTWADAQRTLLGGISQGLILLTVTLAAFRQGPQLESALQQGGLLYGLLVVTGTIFLLHSAALWIGFHGGQLWGFSREDVVAITFAGSQKTLPVGLYVVTELLGGVPFAVYPMLIFHTLQLIQDTFLIAPLQRWRNYALSLPVPDSSDLGPPPELSA
jgi:sodium/bile acid cotransporter 7